MALGDYIAYPENQGGANPQVVTPSTPLPVVVGDTLTKDNVKSLYVIQGVSDALTVHLDSGSVSSQTACMLIDLSDTTNWPHTATGHIHLEYVTLQIDPSATYFGVIRLGFLTNVDTENGDFNQFVSIDMSKKSDLFVETINFGGHGVHLHAAHHFGPVDENNILFQTDLNLGGPDAPDTPAYPSGEGDLVLLLDVTAGSLEISTTLGYRTFA